MIERNWQELQKPEKITVTSSEYNERQAVVSLGPLERGFGTTLGNALTACSSLLAAGGGCKGNPDTGGRA